MTFRVCIEPSGEAFDVETGETVLEAALRSGLALDYGCNNGTCGECKGRVLSGEVREVNFHDYVVSQAEQAENVYLMCSITADSDLVIQAHAASGVDELPLQELTVQVYKVEAVNERVRILHLKTPRTQPLRFFSGQYIKVQLPGLEPRNISISSCACMGTTLQVHVQDAPADAFSEMVFKSLKKSDPVGISGPYGTFVLQADSVRPLILLAFESGFAPVKSLIEDAIALELPQAIHLYRVVAETAGLYMENYCRSWVDAMDNFYYHQLVCDGRDEPCTESGPEDQGLPGTEQDMLRVVDLIIGNHPDLRNYDIYIAGPDSLIEKARMLLLGHGVMDMQICMDRKQAR